jgi:hypothetical protein
MWDCITTSSRWDRVTWHCVYCNHFGPIATLFLCCSKQKTITLLENFTFLFLNNYSLRVEIFVDIDFFHNFDHSSYSKINASIIDFACYMLYYYTYFNLALSFYTFAIIFLNKTSSQSWKKKSTATSISIRSE